MRWRWTASSTLAAFPAMLVAKACAAAALAVEVTSQTC
jgi:hypothetical protein